MTSEKQRAERIILLTIAAFVPTIAMVPIGGYFLWRDGYLLHWALAALASSSVVFALQWWFLAKPSETTAQLPANQLSGMTLPASIDRLAATTDVEQLTSTDGLISLAGETLTLVARHMHPERADAIWQFTVPQALAITEQVSRRVQAEIVSKIPFGDRLTLAQVMQVYRFRSAFAVADKLYDIWRVIRLANPATAATHEARERLSKAAVSWGRDQLMRRLTRIYVEQVARAGIDLYKGRLVATATPDASKKVD